MFTLMGTGCQQVRRIYKKGVDIVIGEWKDGRMATFRGIRDGKGGYGGTAYGTEGIASAGLYEGYEHLVKEILQFFSTGKAPVNPDETLEIFAFMQAAELSKKMDATPVRIDTVLKEASY